MNVIVTNKYNAMLQSLDIDIIKSMNGVFDADEIVSTFQNFYYQRMILDITAIKDYNDIKNLQKLSISLDMDKVILLLDGTPECATSEYLSKLISMGIYNFTTNVDGIMYLYNNPNTYRDVAHIHQIDMERENPSNVNEKFVNVGGGSATIIGIKNLTKQAGATTLTYLMKKILSRNYSVVAIEVDKRDFIYFNDKDLISTKSSEIGNVVSKNSGNDVILIDLNNSIDAEGLCKDVIYLLEPSIIKLNKLMLADRNVFTRLKKKKIVLNKSLLSSKDILEFEYESKAKIFYNLPPLDDRERNIQSLGRFLSSLGFNVGVDEQTTKRNKILGIF